MIIKAFSLILAVACVANLNAMELQQKQPRKRSNSIWYIGRDGSSKNPEMLCKVTARRTDGTPLIFKTAVPFWSEKLQKLVHIIYIASEPNLAAHMDPGAIPRFWFDAPPEETRPQHINRTLTAKEKRHTIAIGRGCALLVGYAESPAFESQMKKRRIIRRRAKTEPT